MLTGHGNDLYNYTGKLNCDFSSNIPYRNASGIVADYLRNRLEIISNYPDPDAREITSQLAGFHSVSPENILVTNGSAEVFYLLAHYFQNRKSVIPFPAFSEYEDACRAHRHDISFLPLKSFHGTTRFEADTVWFGVPNNPDGTFPENNAISRFCSENPNTCFIADMAYNDLCLFSSESESVKTLHNKFNNLITVHSLTKTFGIPGLRLGYIIANRRITNAIRCSRPPWSVNALALEAGKFILDNWNRLLPDTVSICAESARLQRELAAFPQLDVTISPCNFFLVKMKEGTASELKRFLIDKFGLLIRDASNFRGLTAQHFRISVQCETCNRRLVEALKLFFTK